jgi:hypothetical protein
MCVLLNGTFYNLVIVLKIFDGIGNESSSNATLCEMLSIDQIIKYIVYPSADKNIEVVLLHRLQGKIMPNKIQIINSHKCRFQGYYARVISNTLFKDTKR